MRTNLTYDDEEHTRELTASPAHRLMLAVLEEALITFHRGLNSRWPEQRHHSHEVSRWVASKDGRLLFSFENICSSLKIDPGYVREGLKRLQIEALAGKQIRKPHGLRRERMYDRRAWRGHILSPSRAMKRGRTVGVKDLAQPRLLVERRDLAQPRLLVERRPR